MAKGKRPVEKNKTYKARIVDYTHEGLGVAKVEGYPVFIEEVMVDEEIEFKVVKASKNFGYGIVKKILTASEDRVERIGKVYSQTGTMNLQHMSYPAQLKFKQNQVENVLRKIAHIDDVEVGETIGMNFPYEYRNKAQVPVREDGNGNLFTGFFRKRSHEVIPIENFVIQHPVIDDTIVKVRTILQKYGLRGYDEAKHRGDIRHIIVRRGQFTKEIMVAIVTRTKNIRHQDPIVEEITEQIPDVVSIVQNINPDKTNVILGSDFNVLYGEDAYRDRLFDLEFNISHQSFFQVNSVQTEKLYQTAIDFANISKNDTVIDAYSGIGTLSLSIARKASQVYGIEVVEPAVNNAVQNKVINQIDNARFEVAKAEDWMVEQAIAGIDVDIIFVDPPRKGLDESFIQGALKVQPRQIIYVSCNPSTLARDLKHFTEASYKVKKVQPVDMFPQTHHVECVVLMTRN